MSNTTVEKSQTIVITGLDEDWISGTDSEARLYYIKSVQFIPGAIGDRLIIRNDGIDECEVFDSGICPTAGLAIYERMDNEQQSAPVIDISDCTCSSGSKVIIRWKSYARN